MNQAERVLGLYAEDIFSHSLIAEYREVLHPDAADQQPLADYLKKSFCDLPFRHLETTYSGDAFLCCPSWVPLPAGNIFEEDPAEVWNSPSARAIRRSILDGSYRYCSRVYCHLMQNRTLPPRTVDPTLDKPHRDGSTTYRGYSIWIWNGGYLGIVSEPPAESMAQLTLDDVANGERGRFFFHTRQEDVKSSIDEFLDRLQSKEDVEQPVGQQEELSTAELARLIDAPKPNYSLDKITVVRDLATERVDAYAANGIFYAVPRGEEVSARSLARRGNSWVVPAWNKSSLAELIGIFDKNLSLGVHDRPIPHLEYMPRGPGHAAFSHDRSCNVSCPSCRVKRFTASRTEQALYDESMPALLSFLRGTDFITVTGGGDPFASKHYRELLKRLNGTSQAKLILHTNGLLFDERAWTELELAGRVAHVTVSIDAATPQTYERIRRGSKWPTLQARLEFITGKRREGLIEHLDTNFTVQRSNYSEMAKFAKWMIRLGFDKVKFSIVRNIGAYTTEQYEAEDVSSARHPEHQAFIDSLRDPIFEHPQVDLGNCTSYRHAA